MHYYKLIKGGKVVSIEIKSAPALSPGFTKTTRRTARRFLASLPVIKPQEPGASLEDRVAALEVKARE